MKLDYSLLKKIISFADALDEVNNIEVFFDNRIIVQGYKDKQLIFKEFKRYEKCSGNYYC